MVKTFLIAILMGLIASCGVKKSPTPLYSYPLKFESDATPTPTPKKKSKSS